MRRPSVLFVLANDWYFYWHRLALAQRIAAAGYDVHVATPGGRFCGLIEAAGLAHHPIEIDRQGLNAFKDLATIKHLVDLYRELDPALVHHVAVKPILYGSIAAKLAKVPATVNSMPGMGYVFLSKQALARAIRLGVVSAFRLLLNSSNSRVIVENHDDMARWIAWGVIRADRITVIRGGGIDTDAFRPAPEPPGPPVVILPGRLLYDKGVGEFVEAARSLRRGDAAARFALVGEGDPGNPASVPPRQLAQWKDEGVVELFGWQEDMARTLSQSHIVCLPSYGEGLSRALIEAAACGRPIVATDVPGCRDVVRHGDNGLLVPPRQAGALAAALAQLIADGDMRRAMGARGRERVLAEFTVDVVAGETLRLYAELLGARVSTPSRA